ncbi:lysine/arginine/ornithine ABC transporter substrate-binding protein [Erwinia sp. S38]|uniref:lysine/arginine/ornithine ABC transporter substrate-binding protein n=1 Tax=Erwinia sp. S38 TaxID=2769338 RepID=UPI00190A0B38|nr:lysine/arginine/ornithine ABC transporter substrate-binding protein [Erwinia sp. S38]MBK0004404.1 transporter substrate-binding domain-containing protein [Erwinia sp. S38]
MSVLKTVVAGIIVVAGLSSQAVMAKEWKEIRIATEGTYKPFSYIADGKLTGFDVDIANALCEKMQAKCTIVSQEWDGMIPGLMSGKYDATVASMSITPERQKKIDFTDKYYATPARFIAVKESEIKETTPESLKGITVGVQGSTSQASYLEDNFKGTEVKMYKTVDDANMDLANGRIDLVFSDAAILADWMKSADGACCKFVGGDVRDEKYFGVGKGIGVRKSDPDLRDRFNAAIKAIIADGTYDRINKKYFDFSIQ